MRPKGQMKKDKEGKESVGSGSHKRLASSTWGLRPQRVSQQSLCPEAQHVQTVLAGECGGQSVGRHPRAGEGDG